MKMDTGDLHRAANLTAGNGSPAGGEWLGAARRYVAAVAAGNLLWEYVQLPLYTIWYEGSTMEILFAVAHCTGGDVLIAGTALLGALLVAGDRRWPRVRFRAVAAIAILGGQIGRASCRERVCQYGSTSVVAVSLKKKQQK